MAPMCFLLQLAGSVDRPLLATPLLALNYKFKSGSASGHRNVEPSLTIQSRETLTPKDVR